MEIFKNVALSVHPGIFATIRRKSVGNPDDFFSKSFAEYKANCPNWSFLGPPGEPRGHFHGLPTDHLRYEIQFSTHLRCLEPLMVNMALSDQSRPFLGFNFEGAYSKTVLYLFFCHLYDIYRKYPANINLFPEITFTQNRGSGGQRLVISSKFHKCSKFCA